MKKNGFTLVELLATIAIIAIIGTIATGGVLVASNNIQKNLLNSKRELILQGAIEYGQENRIYLDSSCTVEGVEYEKCNTITVGYIESDYLNPKDKCGEINCFKNNLTDKNMKDDEIAVYVKNNRISATFTNKISDN